MVNIENVTKWAEALEDESRTQCKGVLNDGVGMCCLGVATDVYIKEMGLEWEPLDDVRFPHQKDNNLAVRMSHTLDGEGNMLPDKVVDWLGFDGNNPLLLATDEAWGRDDATSLNDDFEYTFADIAAAVRRTYLNG